jgi:hypothetical protein
VLADCVHPVHQRATIFGWELAKPSKSTQPAVGSRSPAL